MKLQTQESIRQSSQPIEIEENQYLERFLQILRESSNDLATLIRQKPYDHWKYSRIANLLHALGGKVQYLLRTRVGERIRRNNALSELITLLEHELQILEQAPQKMLATVEEKLMNSVLNMKTILSDYSELAASL